MLIRLDPSDQNGLTLMDGDREALLLGSLLTLYFDNGHTPEGRRAVVECFEDYQAVCGQHLRWVADSKLSGWHDITKSPSPSPKHWLPSYPDESWEFTYHGSQKHDAASAFEVQALGSASWEAGRGKLSYLRAHLPLSWCMERPEAFIDLAVKWCSKLCPVYGYGGIGILVPSAEFSWQQAFEPLVHGIAFQLLGVEVDYPLTHSRFFAQGIKGASWLTILGRQWIERIGGSESLHNSLGGDIHLIDYTCGLMLRAGEKPTYGDLTSGDNIDVYRRLSAVLKPIRVNEHSGVHYGGSGKYLNSQEFRKWLARFD